MQNITDATASRVAFLSDCCLNQVGQGGALLEHTLREQRSNDSPSRYPEGFPSRNFLISSLTLLVCC